jgi:hypothetical protein
MKGIGGRFTLSSSFRGAHMREPGIHLSTVIAVAWIPGLRLSAHPGMTAIHFDTHYRSRAANRLRVVANTVPPKQRAQGMPDT